MKRACPSLAESSGSTGPRSRTDLSSGEPRVRLRLWSIQPELVFVRATPYEGKFVFTNGQ